MAACTAVLDTAELLEFILLELDTRTLLLAQRVDRQWHQVIRNSKSLQKKLFLLPTNTFDELLDLGLLNTKPEKYNILDATSNRSKQWLEQVVILNDLLFDTTREWKLRPVPFADPAERSGKFIPSWQRMYLTQPPPSTGKGDVMFWFEDTHDNDELCEDVNTLGDMMQKVYVKEASLPEFNVHWQSAAVRPVKHAVDGVYYMKLRSQRQRDAGKPSAFIPKQQQPPPPPPPTTLPLQSVVDHFEAVEAWMDDNYADTTAAAAAAAAAADSPPRTLLLPPPSPAPYHHHHHHHHHHPLFATAAAPDVDDITWPDQGAEFANL
jgi:hypothetical protein